MLDYAEKKYGRGFVSDVKALKNVCYIFLPLPIFWALFDQQVSLPKPHSHISWYQRIKL